MSDSYALIYTDLKELCKTRKFFCTGISILLIVIVVAVWLTLQIKFPGCSITSLGCLASKPAVVVVPPPIIKPTPAPLPPPKASPPRIGVIESKKRPEVRERMEGIVEDDYDIVQLPLDDNFLHQIDKIARQHPVLLLAHLHAIRKPVQGESHLQRDLHAEVELMRGLFELVSKNSDTRILLYSSSFKIREVIDSYCVIQDAAHRSADAEGQTLETYKPLLERIAILPWPDVPTSAEEAVLKRTVAASINRSLSMTPYATPDMCRQRLQQSLLDSQRRAAPASPT